MKSILLNTSSCTLTNIIFSIPTSLASERNPPVKLSLTCLVDQWLTNINNNEFNGVLSIDITKSLLRKLALCEMSDCVMELFRSYLNNRLQCVNVCTRQSSPSTLMYGIPQSSVLGPILFSLCINDLPLYITALCELFADDTSLYNHHADLTILHASLQNCIDKLAGLK